MAATTLTSSSVWGSKPGAWALDSEQHEDELAASAAADKMPAPAEAPAAEFPSLSAAVVGKPKKKAKQVLSLAEFSNYKPPSAKASAAADVVLPTGPRERTAEEIAESRRGGFRNYGGGDRESRARVSRDDGDREREMGPSRADENDDWSRGKKVSSFGSGSDRERDMGPSRADEVDDWSKGKRFGGGDNARVERKEKVGFFGSSRADDVDNWGSKKAFVSGSGLDDRRRERRVGFEATGPGRDVDNWVKGKENGGGVGGGGSRPRLNLQPRTLPVEPINVVVSDSNGNGNGNVGGGEKEEEEVVVAVEVKPKANPFGAARPREEVLKEKGKDWKEIDEKLEAVKIKEGVERSSFDSIGKRRGFGLGGGAGSGAGDNGSVGAWRKSGSPSYAAVAVAPPTPTTTAISAEAGVEKNNEAETTEEVRAEN